MILTMLCSRNKNSGEKNIMSLWPYPVQAKKNSTNAVKKKVNNKSIDKNNLQVLDMDSCNALLK